MPASAISLLDTNLVAHRTRWGFVPGVAAESACVRVELTGGQWPRVSLQVPDGRWLRVHSDRQPLDEAARVIAQSAGEPVTAPLVCIVGAGYGYTLDVLEAQAHAATKLLVLEPEPAFLRHCLGRRDWSALIAAGRLMVLSGPAYAGRTEAWRLVTPDAPDPVVIRHPVIGEARAEAAHDALRVVAQAVTGARANDEARRQFGGRYVLNTLRNLPHIVNGADPGALRDRFEGVPAVIVGAGPSLDRTLAALRSVADRALVIATDTAWRPLVTAGIHPALVVAADPSATNGRHLLDIPSRRETWLIAEGSVAPEALDAAAGRVATFRIGDHHPWPWLRAAGVQRPSVRIWGSVLTGAFDLALTFGCNPVVFLGADLAYTDGRPYCRGTTFEHDWALRVAWGVSLPDIWRETLAVRATMSVPGVDGAAVWTAPHLVEFRNWLVARCAEQPARRFVNATGAGTLFGPGIEQSDLESVLGGAPVREPALRDVLRRALQPSARTRELSHALDRLLAEHFEPGTVPSDAGASPVAEWLAFGRPSLTVADLQAAAMSGRSALDAPRRDESGARLSTPAPAAWTPRVHTADRVARIRALLTGQESLLEGIAHVDTAQETLALASRLDELDEVLDRLLTMPALVMGPGADGGHADAPLSYRFTWTTEATPLVARFEELVLAIEDSQPGVRNQRGFLSGAGFWTRPIKPIQHDETSHPAETAAVDYDALARALLTRQWHASQSAADAPSALLWRREQRIIDAIIGGLTDPQLLQRADAPYRLDLHAGRSRQPCPLRIDAFMRALTGTLATAGEDGAEAAPLARRVRLTSRRAPGVRASLESRHVFLHRDVSYLEPDILTDRELARCWQCVGAADGQSATVTPHLSLHSVRIFQNGEAEPCPAWPQVITGEVPWGQENGALAWNELESIVLFRARAEDDAVVTHVPFRPRGAAAGPDGSAFWMASNGGIWVGPPDNAATRLVETPECGSPYVEGHDLCLVPFVRNDIGHVIRRWLPHRYLYAMAGRTLRQVPVGPDGPYTSITSNGGWTARTFVYMDLIDLQHPDGRAVSLACHGPFQTAWCGPSLLVTTSEGAVLLFRNLAGHLDDRFAR